MSSILIRGSQKELTIPAGEKIGINSQYGESILYYLSDSNTYYEEARIFKNAEYFGPVTATTKIKLIAGVASDVIYDIGKNPQIIQSENSNWKSAVRVASTENAIFSTAFAAGQTIDDVVLEEGDRILIKDQDASEENGIYSVQESGEPTRTSDADTGEDLVSANVSVQEGTLNSGIDFYCTNTSIDLGIDYIYFIDKSSTVNHETLSGLLGGDLSGYYHLDSVQHTKVIDIDSVLQVNSPNLGLGILPTTASGTAFHIHDTTVPRLRLTNDITGSSSTDGGEVRVLAGNLEIVSRDANIDSYSGSGSLGTRLDGYNDFDIANGNLKISGTQVVSSQGASVSDASGGVTIDTEARTAINDLLARLRDHGLIAT